MASKKTLKSKAKKPVKKTVKKAVKKPVKTTKKVVKKTIKPKPKISKSPTKRLVKPGIKSKAKKTLKKNSDVLIDLRDELRIISMEYADIRARLSATDHYITHLLDKIDEEATFRKMNFMMSLALLVGLIIILVLMGARF